MREAFVQVDMTSWEKHHKGLAGLVEHAERTSRSIELLRRRGLVLHSRPKLVRLSQLEFTVRLLINPKESDHQVLAELFATIRVAVTQAEEPMAKAAAVKPLIDQINAVAQAVLKR